MVSPDVPVVSCAAVCLWAPAVVTVSNVVKSVRETFFLRKLCVHLKFSKFFEMADYLLCPLKKITPRTIISAVH